MDLWVVAAAVGAGYLAKYWNRISKNEDSSGHLSSEDFYLENPASPSCRFRFPKQARKDESGKDVPLDRRGSDGKSSDLSTVDDGLLTGDIASSRGHHGENTRRIGNCNKSDVLSLSNLAGSLSPFDDNFKDVEDRNDKSSDIVGTNGFFLPDSSAEVVCIHNSSGQRTFLRTKNLYGPNNGPLSSLESCFMAQLYKHHAEMEAYVLSSLSSPSTTTRTFLVSNGSQIINRENDNLFSSSIGNKHYRMHKEAGEVKDDCVFGIPSLPKIVSIGDAKKMKFNAVNGRSRRLSDGMFSGKLIQSQSDATFLFSLGVSLGIITSIMANKREIDKLRGMLKQTENLVQDLQEELEMKDALTVKELHNENYGSQDTCDHSFNDKELHEYSPEKHTDNSPRIDCQEYDQKVEQSSESMSKIEAELEAELERLGLNMNASSLERKFSELVEIDPEFVADFAQGVLRAEVSEKYFVHSKSKEDATDATPLPGNFTVLPHELCLRLHEVIQSQLEERVKELEIALENSERKLQLKESEHEGYSQKASSFARENPSTDEDCDPMSQPLILNLSGEALDAYNETYEELIKINDSEENSPLEIHDSDQNEGSHSYNWHALGFQYGGANDSISYSPVNEVTMLGGQSSSIYELNENGDESCGLDNEVEQQLIRQIVERTKNGSPVFKNAQMILYSMDEDEH